MDIHISILLLILYCKGESNLKFIFFMLRQIDNVRSISTVRNFKLPQMAVPQKVHNYDNYYIHLVLMSIISEVLLCNVPLGLKFVHNNRVFSL